jgi:hypothetical protein
MTKIIEGLKEKWGDEVGILEGQVEVLKGKVDKCKINLTLYPNFIIDK